MDQATTEFNASMDDLNLYMEENFVRVSSVSACASISCTRKALGARCTTQSCHRQNVTCTPR